MSDNPLTKVLLTALMEPSKLKPLAQAAVKEVVGLAIEAAGAGMRQSAEKQGDKDAPDQE